MSSAVVDAPAATRCPRCGTELAPGQDWCLECGTAATTHVIAPPGWRVPVAVVALIVALLAAGVAIAVAELWRGDEGPATATAPVAAAPGAAAPAAPAPQPGAAAPAPASTAPAPTATAPAPAPGTTATTPAGSAPATPALATWPAGTRAYTVVLASPGDRAAADARARQLAGAAADVGVLRSDEYRSLRKGYWVVFSGRYGNADQAVEAARKLQGAAPGAYARLIDPR
jgi:SPOR domain